MRYQQQYELGIDLGGLIVFLVLMLPNLVWFVFPAQNDVLKTTSDTPIIDSIGMCFQILMIATLCCIQRKGYQTKWTPLSFGIMFCVIVYYAGWFAYYAGNINNIIVLLLAFMPCMSFILLAVERRNMVALLFTLVFTFCHIVSSIVNFIL